MHRLIVLLFLLIIAGLGYGQKFPYDLKIDSINITNLTGLQSFVVGQAEGKWLLIGGRTDGLHLQDPNGVYNLAGRNTQFIVVDPINKVFKSASLESLSSDLQNQLSGTEMQFLQKGELLYIVGGYGYDQSENNHVTFPFLTVINVPEVITSIEEMGEFGYYIHQIRDEKFAVKGGELSSIDGLFYLIGGVRTDGVINPTNAPIVIQSFTNSVRTFTVEVADNGLMVTHYDEISNEQFLRRKDFNAFPQILPDGKQGIVVLSGLYKTDTELPYTNAILIKANGMTTNSVFSQYYNHYSCPSVALFDEKNNTTHNLLFGGFAQYYDSAGIVIQNDNLPFVKTISRIEIDQTGWIQENKLQLEMPGFLGASAEFIVNPKLPLSQNGIVELNKLASDTILLGYIFGGLRGSRVNEKWIKNGIESTANNVIYPIYLFRNEKMSANGQNDIQLRVFPNPTQDEVTLSFVMRDDGFAEVLIENMMGEEAYSKTWKGLDKGLVSRSVKYNDLDRGEYYYVHVTVKGMRSTQKILFH